MFEATRRSVVRTISARHIAGPDLKDALSICGWAQGRGIRTIISPWASAGQRNEEMFSAYASAIERIRQKGFDSYLSLKLEAIGYDQSFFEELVEVARRNEVRIHLDSLGPDSAPKNLSFLEKARASYGNLGCTIPSRWMRSLYDAERAIDLGLSIRIVKGQWIDPDAPRLDCRKNYLALASRLAGRANRVAIATHDPQLASKALLILSKHQKPFELEQFFSLPLNGKDIAEKYRCPYRLYVAYGQPGVPYNVRFSLSRPSILAWMLTDFALKPKRPWVTEKSEDRTEMETEATRSRDDNQSK